MLGLAATADVSVDANVVRRVCYDLICENASSQPCKIVFRARVAAKYTVFLPTHLPDIAGSGDVRPVREFDRIDGITNVGRMVMKNAVGFAGRKSSYADIKIDRKLGEHNGEVSDFCCQNLTIPARVLGNLVVGKDIGSLFGLAQDG